jgi:hypothetical protein
MAVVPDSTSLSVGDQYSSTFTVSGALLFSADSNDPNVYDSYINSAGVPVTVLNTAITSDTTGKPYMLTISWQYNGDPTGKVTTVGDVATAISNAINSFFSAFVGTWVYGGSQSGIATSLPGSNTIPGQSSNGLFGSLFGGSSALTTLVVVGAIILVTFVIFDYETVKSNLKGALNA